MQLVRKCLLTGCCIGVVFIGGSAGEAQKGAHRKLLPDPGTTSSVQQIIPYLDNSDKSRLVYTVTTMKTLSERVDRYKQEVVEQLLQMTPLLAPPRDGGDFQNKLNNLNILLPALQVSLERLDEALSRFTERRVDVPYLVALYPALRFHEDSDSSFFSVGVTYSDDTIALDITGQYMHLQPLDEGFALFAKHEVTPSKYAASRALRVLAAEVYHLSTSDVTRMITEVRQIAEAVESLKAGALLVHEGIRQLQPLVEELSNDPRRLEELRNTYEGLVAPFGRSIGKMQGMFGSRGEEFDRFFSRFRTAVQEAHYALVRSALAPHFAITGGTRSFRRLGKATTVGFALAQQIPLAPESGVLCNLSGQYTWLDPRNGEETTAMIWGLTVAWMDRLSSFSEQGTPILRRWQWQVGIEYHPASSLLHRSYGAFVRWRPAERLDDYLLFWMREDSGENTFGIGVRWMFGVKRH